MNTKRNRFRIGNQFVIFMIICLIPVSEGFARIQNYEQSYRYYEAVEVPGELLEGTVGRPLSSLALYSYSENGFEQVVCQLDEKTSNGSYIFTHGKENNKDESNGIFDRQDLLVFMARDAGEMAPADTMPEMAENIIPIELRDPLTGDTYYVYFASFKDQAPIFEFKPYITVDDSEGKFNIRSNSFGYDGLIKNKGKKSQTFTVFMDKFWLNPEIGGNGQNIIDRQKVRGKIRFLGGLVKVGFGEEMVNGGVVAYKKGPVRINVHSVMYPKFPMGIKGPKFYIDTVMIDTITLIRTIMGVPFNPGALITDMTLSFGQELSENAKGMIYYSSENPEGFLIDGKKSKKEKKYSTAKNKWYLVVGPQGSQIQKTVFDPKFLVKGEESSIFNDDETDKHPPENFPGDIGATFDQLKIKALASGIYHIDTTGFMPDFFYKNNSYDKKYLEGLLHLQDAPLHIKIGNGEIKNKGMENRQLLKTKLDKE